MAEEDFKCSVCLDTFTDPVSIPCGHNFCMVCINAHWDIEDSRGIYTCPLCKRTFTPRPVVHKNLLLKNLIEQFHRAVLQPPQASQESLDRGNACSQHGRPLDRYCLTDQTVICNLCVQYEHNGHSTTSARAEWNNKKTQLRSTQERVKRQIHDREDEQQSLITAVENIQDSVQAAVDESDEMFTKMIRSMEDRHSVLNAMIRSEGEAEVSLATQRCDQLTEEIAELRRKDAELQQLSDTQDPIHFLQIFPYVNEMPFAGDTTNIMVDQSFVEMKNLLKQFGDQLEEANTNQDSFLNTMQVALAMRRPSSEDDLPMAVALPSMVPSAVVTRLTEPQTREEFLEYLFHFQLDKNTANRHLHLSEGNQQAERKNELQPYPDHPDRFDRVCQVLSTEGVSGRHYWEVEWGGQWASIAVSYKSISRKGESLECRFGHNDQSWRLPFAKLAIAPCSKIGVYVDYRAGTLAFYSVSQRMTLLHRVQTTFTQPLHAGFGFYGQMLCGTSSMKFL